MAAGGRARDERARSIDSVPAAAPHVTRELPVRRATWPVRDRVAAALVRLRQKPWLLTLVGLGTLWLAAFALRALFLGRSYDVFIDEVTYLILSENVAGGEGVTLSGKPFFLHPPLFFLIEGPFLWLLPDPRFLIDELQNVRLLNAILAACTAVVLYAIAARTAGPRLGLVAFAFFVIDAFVIKMNSRNLLETSAMLWVTLGYLCLLAGLRADPDAPTRRRYVLAVGVFFGLALLTKEMTAFLTLLPLGIAFLTRWFAPRRSIFAAGVVAAATYALYPIVITLTGLAPTFLAQKLDGLLRFLGVMKTTGFVHGTGPSFIEAIVRNLDVFATTYALLGLGIPACLILLAAHDRRRRLLGVFGVSAYSLLAYSITLGTLEEQFFYFLVVPAFLSVPVAWATVLGSNPDTSGAIRRLMSRLPERGRQAARRLAAGALAISLGWSGIVWTEVHLTPDNGYEQLLDYLHREVPFGTEIGVTSEPAEFILQGYVIDKVPDMKALTQTDADYVVVATKQIDDEYILEGRELYTWLATHGQREFVVHERTYGRLELYALRGANTLVDERFDTLPIDAGLPDPWRTAGLGRVAVEGIPSIPGHTLGLRVTRRLPDASACYPLPATGLADLDVSLDVRFDGVAAGSLVSLRAAGAEVAGLHVDSLGVVRASGATATTVPAGTWQHISIQLQPTAGTFGWQIRPAGAPDGEAVRGSGVLNVLEAPIDAVCFSWRSLARRGSLSVDNVLVRD